MSVNNVIIGDLAEFRGDDCLKFDGVDDYATIVQTTEDLSLDITIDEVGTTWKVISQIGSYDVDFDGYILHVDTDLRLAIRSNNDVVTKGPIISGGDRLELDIINTNTEIRVYLGGELSLTHTKTSTGSYVGKTVKLMKRDNTDFLKGCLNSISDGAYTYINNGDFGDSVLTSKPSGNDGTIVGAQWWKQGVDENFLTPTAYRNAWIIPMEQSQNVIYTDGTPYYPTADTYWNPYNQDATYTFTVYQQSAGYTIGATKFNYTYGY